MNDKIIAYSTAQAEYAFYFDAFYFIESTCMVK